MTILLYYSYFPHYILLHFSCFQQDKWLCLYFFYFHDSVNPALLTVIFSVNTFDIWLSNPSCSPSLLQFTILIFSQWWFTSFIYMYMYIFPQDELHSLIIFFIMYCGKMINRLQFCNCSTLYKKTDHNMHHLQYLFSFIIKYKCCYNFFFFFFTYNYILKYG